MLWALRRVASSFVFGLGRFASGGGADLFLLAGFALPAAGGAAGAGVGGAGGGAAVAGRARLLSGSGEADRVRSVCGTLPGSLADCGSGTVVLRVGAPEPGGWIAIAFAGLVGLMPRWLGRDGQSLPAGSLAQGLIMPRRHSGDGRSPLLVPVVSLSFVSWWFGRDGQSPPADLSVSVSLWSLSMAKNCVAAGPIGGLCSPAVSDMSNLAGPRSPGSRCLLPLLLPLFGGCGLPGVPSAFSAEG